MTRFIIFFSTISLFLFGLVEPYLYRTLKKLYFQNKVYRKIRFAYFFFLTLSVISIVTMITYYSSGYAKFDKYGNWAAGYFFANLISKIFLILLLSIIDSGLFIKKRVFKNQSSSSRRKFVKKAAILTSFFPFASLIYGTLKGRYQFKVFRQPLSFIDLPKSFSGFRIAQISDVHSGSWDNLEEFEKGLNILMQEKPDMILLTGDLVNNIAEEAEPFVKLFQKLSAPYGMYAVMGNHDYGYHYHWKSEDQKAANIQNVKRQYARMGFELLNNSSKLISKNGDKIRLLGIENWGKFPFPQYGDLNLALKNVDPQEFKILMSHDPDHWEQWTLAHPYKVHLTLSGHTHGSQMGVDIPGFKFSPVMLRYKRWIGLYREGEEYLYVNRGFGYIGYPGRVGIRPEITIFNLNSKSTLSC